MQSRILNEIVGDRPNRLSAVEAAWLAGVIDGEGSIGLYNFGKEGRRVEIQVSNTNIEFVANVRKFIGCGSSVMRSKFGILHKGRKPIYHYMLKGSARCYVVLKQILPYLIIKKGLAEKILKEIEEKPFGRWKNATEEARKKASDWAKKSWQNPIHRWNRLEGLRRYHLEVKQ